MTLPELAHVMAALRARLAELQPETMHAYSRGPVLEAEIEQIRSWYLPRHLSDEFVEFLRLGPVGLFGPATVAEHQPGPGGSGQRLESDADQYIVETVLATGSYDNEVPLSSNWVLLGHCDNWWYTVSTPKPAERATVIFWDCGGPSPPQVVFPSLRSLLWVWLQMLDDPELGEDPYPRGFIFQLAASHPRKDFEPSTPSERRYAALRRAAIAAEDPHPGWVANQATPEGRSDWTLEWLIACGVADVDLRDQRLNP